MKPRAWLDCTFLWHDEDMLAVLTLREAESGAIEAALFFQKKNVISSFVKFSIREGVGPSGVPTTFKNVDYK